jgi:hypothetical protein
MAKPTSGWIRIQQRQRPWHADSLRRRPISRISQTVPGLELFVNPNQKSTTGLWTGDREVEVPNASDETVARDKVTGKDGTWPQLTLLLHSMVSEFPWR